MRLALGSGVFWAAAVPATTVANNAKAIHFGKSFIEFSPVKPYQKAIGADASAQMIPKPRTASNLFVSDHRVPLNFDLSVRRGQGGDRYESAAREIVTEYLSADLGEAIAVANIRNKYGHLNHITQLAARLLESAVEVLEKLPDLTVEVTR
jgi:hypothetical protein